MKKGFTLIELLAVILILGIIALIAIPVVNNIIKESKQGAFKASVENTIGAAETKCQLQQVKGETITTNYDFSDSDIKTKINVKGNLPTSGTITLNDSCVVTNVNVTDGTFTATLEGDKVSVTTNDNSGKTCTLKSGTALAIGSKYQCRPGDGTTRNFYVLEVTTDNVSLIMDSSIGTSSFCAAGVEYEECNGEGAKAALPKNWSNVTVSLPTYQQLMNISEDNDFSDNLWLFDHMNGTMMTPDLEAYYWTDTVEEYNSLNAYAVCNEYKAVCSCSYAAGYKYHVRPVITLSKSDIE